MRRKRTWTCHEIAIQRGYKTLLILVGRDNGDILPFLPRKSLCLVLERLRKRVAADSVHEATMNLLSLFIDTEQQPEKPSPVSKGNEQTTRYRTSSPLYCSLRESHNLLS